jgi:hypothetical protein
MPSTPTMSAEHHGRTRLPAFEDADDVRASRHGFLHHHVQTGGSERGVGHSGRFGFSWRAVDERRVHRVRGDQGLEYWEWIHTGSSSKFKLQSSNRSLLARRAPLFSAFPFEL